MTKSRTAPDVEALTSLFYETPEELGAFTEVAPADMPDVSRRLLNHHDHMTVTVEAFHDDMTDVQVLETHVTRTHYSRKILLRRRSDRRVVLFGLVRLHLESLTEPARAEIESQRTPLGHVLIKHNVLRHVLLLTLWRIVPGEELLGEFELPEPVPCYGRTALIYCNGVPAVELLEILPP